MKRPFTPCCAKFKDEWVSTSNPSSPPYVLMPSDLHTLTFIASPVLCSKVHNTVYLFSVKLFFGLPTRTSHVGKAQANNEAPEAQWVTGGPKRPEY